MALQSTSPAVSPMESIEVIHEREDGLVEAMVPVGSINNEEVAVDDEHVGELAGSMEAEAKKGKNRTGQLSAVLLGEVPGEITFPIVDGFHRSAALARLGRASVYSTIKLDTTWEDVIDLRIMTARAHKKVHFPRIVEWVEEAWQRTEWHERMPISTACQLLLLSGNGNTGSRFGIQPNEAAQIKAWVAEKCDKWRIGVGRLDQYLRTARTADPLLVKAARERPGGSKLEVVTPRHLGEISRTLPGNYPLQNVVADGATEHNLTIPQTRALALAVSQAPDTDAAREMVENQVWLGMDSSAVSLIKKRYADIDPTSPDSYAEVLRDKFFDDQIQVCELLIERAVLLGHYVPRPEDRTIPRLKTALAEAKISVDEDMNQVFESDTQHTPWDTEKLEAVSAQIFALHKLFSNYLWKQFGLEAERAADVISEATIKFLERANDGRIPHQYSDDAYLPRLMFMFLSNTAKDMNRTEFGRNPASRRTFVSIDEQVGEDGSFTLADTLVADSDPTELSLDTKSHDFFKHILPHVSSRERQILVLRSYFNLTAFEIAQVLGTTEGTVNQMQRRTKAKILSVVDPAVLEDLNKLQPKPQ